MIALVDKDRVVVAYSPSYILNGCKSTFLSPQDLFEEENLLFWKLSGVKNALMGGGAQIRENDLMRYGKKLARGGEITFKRIVKEILPIMREKFRENGFKDEEDEAEEGFENEYLIAQDNRLYEIRNNLVLEKENYLNLGPFDTEATGAILDESEGLTVEEKLYKIAEFFEEAEGLPMFPLAVMDTKTLKLKIINR